MAKRIISYLHYLVDDYKFDPGLWWLTIGGTVWILFLLFVFGTQVLPYKKPRYIIPRPL